MAETPENNKTLYFIIDGEVVLNLRTTDRNAAIMTSEPTIVEYDEAIHGAAKPRLGDRWDGKRFIRIDNPS